MLTFRLSDVVMPHNITFFPLLEFAPDHVCIPTSPFVSYPSDHDLVNWYPFSFINLSSCHGFRVYEGIALFPPRAEYRLSSSISAHQEGLVD